MTAGQAFADQVVARLLPLGPVRARRMFGGWGIFLDDVMFALIASERLYLKVDGQTEARFAAVGAEPFVYHRERKRIAMSYREAPAGALDESEALLPWARLGLEAARRARVKRRRKR
ncbi:MAG: TfoX/Sxy family protein [Kiloniellaceae bacterium]